MHPPLNHTVRQATPADAAAVADAIGDAFRDDPVMSWLIPDEGRRHARVPEYFQAVTDHVYLHHREVYLTEDGLGAALWLPPGATASSPPLLVGLRLAWKLFRVAGFGGLRRANTLLSVMSANHPKGPHYYLHALGVRHGQQGRGIGSALIRHVTDRCDREGALAYLENSNERNTPLYERNGFRTVGQWQAPGGGPTIWFMTRQPAGAAKQE